MRVASQPTTAAPPPPSLRPRPSVQVIVVHHRGREMLQECLRTLLATTELRLEVVLFSNACAESLPEQVAADVRVHLVRSAVSLGFAAANNQAVAWAREQLGEPDYLYFVNNDLRHRAQALELLVAAAEARPEAGVLGPQIRIWGADDHLNSLGLNVTLDAWAWDEGIGCLAADHALPTQPLSVTAVTGSALLIRAALFAEVGGWCELYDYYFEDVDLCLRVRERGHEVVLEPQAVVEHRISATMTVGAEQKFFYFWRNRLLLAGLHWPLDEAVAVFQRARQEIADLDPGSSALQRRALAAASQRLPGIFAARHRAGLVTRPWWQLLRAVGSRPTITLPPVAEIGSTEIGSTLTLSKNEVPMAGGADQAGSNEVRPGARCRVAVRSDESPRPAAEAPEAMAPVCEAAEGGREAAASGRDSAVDGSPTARPSTSAARARGAAAGPRVLVLGWGPLPFEPARMNYAPGARSWQFARALADAGAAVVLVTARIPGTTDEPESLLREAQYGEILHVSVGRSEFASGRLLPELGAAFAPQVVVGAAPVPSQRAVDLAAELGGLPSWVDVFGDLMAEGQARAVQTRDDETLVAYQDLLLDLCERGDAFSAVGERQRWALFGQLLLAGRSTAAEAGAPLVHLVPISLPEAVDLPVAAALPASTAPAASFVALWSGGFNTWCDVDTLFAALELAMAELPELVFVATGGQIVGHDDASFPRFAALVATARDPSRYRLLAALPAAEARAWLARADLAVVTERPCAERWLGSSHRVMDWLAAAKPFVCADLSDLAAWIRERDAGLLYAAGDAGSLAERIVWGARHRDELQQMGQRGRQAAAIAFSRQRTTEPLVRWVREVAGLGERRDRPRSTTVALVRRRLLDDERQRSADSAGRRAELESQVEHLERELAAGAAAIEALSAELVAASEERAAAAVERVRLGAQLAARQDEVAVLAGLLTTERARSTDLGHRLGTIHHSRMWRFWMLTLAVRRWLTAPLRWLGMARR